MPKPKSSSFVPKDYEVNTGGSDFFKLQPGDNKFRILTDAVIGKEGWKDNKPFRRGGVDAEIDVDEVDEDEKSGKPKINDFMAFYVLDHSDGKIKVAQFNQASIRKELVKYASDSDWGHPENYDITITKSGEGLTTKYSFKASPPKPLAPANEKLVAAASPTFDLEGALSIDAE